MVFSGGNDSQVQTHLGTKLPTVLQLRRWKVREKTSQKSLVPFILLKAHMLARNSDYQGGGFEDSSPNQALGSLLNPTAGS